MRAPLWCVVRAAVTRVVRNVRVRGAVLRAESAPQVRVACVELARGGTAAMRQVRHRLARARVCAPPSPVDGHIVRRAEPRGSRRGGRVGDGVDARTGGGVVGAAVAAREGWELVGEPWCAHHMR